MQPNKKQIKKKKSATRRRAQDGGRGHSTIYCPKQYLDLRATRQTGKNENKTLTLWSQERRKTWGGISLPSLGCHMEAQGPTSRPGSSTVLRRASCSPKKYEGQETTRPEPQLEPPGCPLIPRRKRRTSRSPGSPCHCWLWKSASPGLGKGMDSVMAESAHEPKDLKRPRGERQEDSRRVRALVKGPE